MALLPGADDLRFISGIPAVGALLTALVQILRDEAAHEKTLLLQGLQNSFSIGTTSHMAEVAFDKHVAFAEEYAEEVQRTLATLLREADTPSAAGHAADLSTIRRKHAIWLTPDLEPLLERFEAALRRIGSNAWLAETAPGAEGHSERVHEMHAILVEVLGAELRPVGSVSQEGESDRAIGAIIGELRRVLGIEELTLMRSALVKDAVARLKSAG